VLLGDATLYLLGRYGGRPIVRRFVGDERLRRLERAFAARGVRLMFFARFVPGLRSTLLIAAGAGHMRVAQLARYDGAAAAVGVALWIGLGATLGPQIDHAAAIVDGARTVLPCGAIAAALLMWLRHARKKKV
jgi:membrane protein DedA with SNARE-associated domain